MSYAEVSARIATVNDLLNAASVLTWDSRTMMPAGGAASRAHQIATAIVMAQQHLVADDTRRALDSADSEMASAAPDSIERTMLAKIRHAVDHHRRIPADLLRRKAELRTESQGAWVRARAGNDFAGFAPFLERTVALNRELADAIGYAAHPYDALLSQYEPGETAASLDTLFATLRQGLKSLLAKVATAPQPRTDFLHRAFPPDQQRDVAHRLTATIGYDFTRGRLDQTVHPFEVSFTRNDVRITTKFLPDYLPPSVFGALHEAGHGLYEQNVDPAFTRTVLATDLIGLYAVGGTSFGAHESQSRLYENHVGRSRAFWTHHYGTLQSAFPDALGDVDADLFWRGVNAIKPGFIRIEADELTYDFHIMLRVDLERRLLEGSLAVRDLPAAWSEALQSGLGLTPPDDTRGVLQDIHWSSGQMGTFCSYTIGNIMAAQLMDTVATQRPAVTAALEAGDYAPLREWLTDAVHRHGRRYTRDDLLVRATGRPLDPTTYLAYLGRKFAGVYGLAA